MLFLCIYDPVYTCLPIWSLWHVVWRREMRTGCWWGNPKERDHLEGLGLNGR